MKISEVIAKLETLRATDGEVEMVDPTLFRDIAIIYKPDKSVKDEPYALYSNGNKLTDDSDPILATMLLKVLDIPFRYISTSTEPTVSGVYDEIREMPDSLKDITVIEEVTE